MAKTRKPQTDEQRAALVARLAAGRAAKKAKAADAAIDATPEVTEPAEPIAETPAVTLSEDELAIIRAKAREKIDAELAARRAAERESLIAETLAAEVLNQRREAGLTSAADDIIEFMVNVAPFSPGLVWDGHIYPHGTWLKKPRHVYDSMRDVMARSWESEDRAGNPNKRFAAERALVGTQNPLLLETRMPDGTYTVGLVQPSVHGKTGAISGARV